MIWYVMVVIEKCCVDIFFSTTFHNMQRFFAEIFQLAVNADLFIFIFIFMVGNKMAEFIHEFSSANI